MPIFAIYLRALTVGIAGKIAVAHLMMKRFQVDVIASDCHRPYMRTPVMIDVYETLERKYPIEYLEAVFEENPDRICSNEDVVDFAAESEF